MAYSFWWGPLVRHVQHVWLYPFDLFTTVEASRWIGAGAFTYLYSGNIGLVTLPGFALLLTPVVMLSEALHLVSTTQMYPVPEPSQWLLLGPVTMATSAVALGGLDGLARTIGLSLTRRRVLLVAETAVVWPVLVKWGHPEDVLALGLCALAFARAIEGRTVSAGWLLGAALAMQLYVVLAVPVLLGLLGPRRSIGVLARASLIPGGILVVMLASSPHATLHTLFNQPNQVALNHATPWVLAAPHVAPGMIAGGPSRLVGLAGACGLGFLAARHRDEPVMIVWLAAAAFALRCLTEAVMDPYYVEPAIALTMLAVASRSWRRWVPSAAAATGLTVLTYGRFEMWWYWVGMAVPIGVMLAAAWPGRRAARAAGEDAASDPARELGDRLVRT